LAAVATARARAREGGVGAAGRNHRLGVVAVVGRRRTRTGALVIDLEAQIVVCDSEKEQTAHVQAQVRLAPAAGASDNSDEFVVGCASVQRRQHTVVDHIAVPWQALAQLPHPQRHRPDPGSGQRHWRHQGVPRARDMAATANNRAPTGKDVRPEGPERKDSQHRAPNSSATTSPGRLPSAACAGGSGQCASG
jgi:hypothetical protein